MYNVSNIVPHAVLHDVKLKSQILVTFQCATSRTVLMVSGTLYCSGPGDIIASVAHKPGLRVQHGIGNEVCFQKRPYYSRGTGGGRIRATRSISKPWHTAWCKWPARINLWRKRIGIGQPNLPACKLNQILYTVARNCFAPLAPTRKWEPGPSAKPHTNGKRCVRCRVEPVVAPNVTSTAGDSEYCR